MAPLREKNSGVNEHELGVQGYKGRGHHPLDFAKGVSGGR
jgi:hypothetical protein